MYQVLEPIVFPSTFQSNEKIHLLIWIKHLFFLQLSSILWCKEWHFHVSSNLKKKKVKKWLENIDPCLLAAAGSPSQVSLYIFHVKVCCIIFQNASSNKDQQVQKNDNNLRMSDKMVRKKGIWIFFNYSDLVSSSSFIHKQTLRKK